MAELTSWQGLCINNQTDVKGFVMAKRHRINLITASFHYLAKLIPGESNASNPIEEAFTSAEFERIVTRIASTHPVNDRDPAVIARIKSGQDLPFRDHQVVDEALHFGTFDGAYYGQKYRNNQVGEISADSLNLRPFNYLITRLRDGKILVGVTYNGQFGDYDGLRSCLMYLLRGANYHISSRTITSVRDQIGEGVPTELRLTYRNAGNRPERRGLFGRTGVIAIKNTDFGDGFGGQVELIASSIHGNDNARRQVLASLVNQGSMIGLDDEDIVDCSAIIRENGRTTTVYFLGGNNLATKFRLNVDVNGEGVPNQNQVRTEMVRVMREKIIPLMV